MSVSKSTNAVLSKSGSILRALDATGNWPAILLTAASFIAFFLVTAAGTALAAQANSAILAGLFALLALTVLVVGLSASGFMLMDNARGQPSRTIQDALLSSVFSVHRLLLSLLVLLVAYIVWVVALALLLLLCKIPLLGPLLYTLVFPLAVLVSGVFTVFLLYAGMGVIAPSIWDDGSVMQTMARAWAVARERFLALLILSLLLGLLVSVIGGLIFAVFFSGTALVLSMSASILGGHMGGMGLAPGLMGMAAGMAMGGMGEGAGGYMLAAALGGGALLSLVAAIPANIALLGACINYLQLTDGLDISGAQQQIQAKLEEARRRAEAAAEAAKAKAQEMQQQREQQAQARQAAAASAAASTQADADTVVPVAPVTPVTPIPASPVDTPPAPAAATTTPSAPPVPAPAPEIAALEMPPPHSPVCPACHAAVAADDLFCEKCGTKLS